MKKRLKRLLIVICACVLACTGSACGDTSEAGTQATTLSPEDWEYLEAMARDYEVIAAKLDSYRPGEAFHVYNADRTESYSDNDGLRYCYERLVELEEVKAWLDKKEGNHYDPPFAISSLECASYLKKFTVLEDVLLQVDYVMHYADTTKRPETTQAYAVWHYYADGKVCYIENGVWRLTQLGLYRNITFADLFRAYDENGRASYSYFGKLNQYNVVMIPTYDDEGKLISEELIRLQTGETENMINYEYDDLSRLTRVTVHYSDMGYDYYRITYTYDDHGRLLREVADTMNTEIIDGVQYPHNSQVLDYFYGEDGVLRQTLCTYTLWSQSNPVEPEVQAENLWLYAFDEQGRLLSRKIYEYVTHNANGTVQPTVGAGCYEEVYVYGDKYIYGDYEIRLLSTPVE